MAETSSVQAAVGTKAPDFTLKDGDGREWRLSEQRGRVLVLLFYPGDNTPVCTKQLCTVRDRWDDYTATSAEVVGISTNTVESHKDFAAEHKLPLRLLADPEGRVINAYGAHSILPGRTGRSVFVIDADGIIRYRKVQKLGLIPPKTEEIIRAICAAQGKA